MEDATAAPQPTIDIDQLIDKGLIREGCYPIADGRYVKIQRGSAAEIVPNAEPGTIIEVGPATDWAYSAANALSIIRAEERARESKVKPIYGEQRPFTGPTVACGRNEKCPCGSGRKYKHCHRERDAAQYLWAHVG